MIWPLWRMMNCTVVINKKVTSPFLGNVTAWYTFLIVAEHMLFKYSKSCELHSAFSERTQIVLRYILLCFFLVNSFFLNEIVIKSWHRALKPTEIVGNFPWFSSIQILILIKRVVFLIQNKLCFFVATFYRCGTISFVSNVVFESMAHTSCE